jgi:hypothetical protein
LAAETISPFVAGWYWPKGTSRDLPPPTAIAALPTKSEGPRPLPAIAPVFGRGSRSRPSALTPSLGHSPTNSSTSSPCASNAPVLFQPRWR